MKEKNAADIMKYEIDRRIADDAWDLSMAGRVLARRRSRSLKWVMASGAGGLAAAAASIMLVFAPSGKDSVNGAVFHAFVSSQVNGTYGEVFENGITANTGTSETTTLVSYGSLDSVVSGALMDR